MVRIATKTAGAYLRYTLDGSTPTGGLSGNGTQLAAESGKVSFRVGPREKTLKAIAYKPGLADSSMAEGTYVYSRRIEANRKPPQCEMLMRQQI
jgi:hypothetical protein